MPPAGNIFSKRLQRNDWIIILSNLVPVFGVWFLGWSAVEVFIVYALETLILGMLTVLKVSGLFFIIFFILHFGIFAAVQTSIFSGVANISPPGKGPMHFFLHWWEYINVDIAYMLGAFVISYLARDLFPFLLRKEYKTIPMMILMFQPYGRILIQQFTVILGSMFLTFHLGKAFILVFALAKIFVEVFLNFDRLLNRSMDDLKSQ
jgi:hypothetical protein